MVLRFEEEEELPKVYDAKKIKAYWDARPKDVIQRAVEVYIAFVPYLLKLFVWEYLIRGKIADHEGLQRKYAVLLRQLLTDLGPCFIKLGQAISIRCDCIVICHACNAFSRSQAHDFPILL